MDDGRSLRREATRPGRHRGSPPPATALSPAAVRLTGAPETLLATLKARAMDNQRSRPVLGDTMAEALLPRLDYDFDRLRIAAQHERTAVFRARRLDEWASAFLTDHPDAVVLHLGCGLDSRAFRLGPPAGVRWFDVDLPEVVELRAQLYPPRDGYQVIGSSVTEPGWLDAVPDDRATLVIAEGLTPYLTQADGEAMLRRLRRHAPTGAMMFDVVLPWLVRLARYAQLTRATGATFRWGTGDPRVLEDRVPGLLLQERWSVLDARYPADTRAPERALAAAMRRVPALRHAVRLLRYRF